MDNETVSLSRILAAALQSETGAVVARVKANDNSEITFLLQVTELTVDGVTESFVDVEAPPKSQLN